MAKTPTKPARIVPSKPKAPVKKPAAEKKAPVKDVEESKDEIDEEEESDESDEESEDEDDSTDEEGEQGSDEDDEEDEGAEKPPKITSSQKKEGEDEFNEAKAPEGDYLQAYQYKKVNDTPTIGGPLTNPDMGSKAEVMKQALLKQPRIFTLIPLPEGTDPKVLFSVCLNGYRLDFPTNSYLYLPQQISDLIRKSNNQTNAALAQFRTDNDEKKAAAGL